MENYNQSAGRKMLETLKEFEKRYELELYAVKKYDSEIPTDIGRKLKIFSNILGNRMSISNIRNVAMIYNDSITCEDIENAKKSNPMEYFKSVSRASMYYSAAFFAMYHWRKYKKLYSIDNDLINELKPDGDFDIPISSIISTLPFDSFYVNAKISDQINGFFVTKADSHGKPALVFTYFDMTVGNYLFTIDSETNNMKLMREKMKKLISSNIDVDMDDDDTVTTVFNIKHSNGSNEHVCYKDFINYIINPMYSMIAIVMYIVSAEADVSNKPARVKLNYTSPTAKKKKGPKDPYVADEFKVGIVVGPALKREREEHERIIEEIKTRKLSEGVKYKSPHVRKAHWHSYWVGKKGNQTLIVKWVAPCYINGYSENTKFISVRPVED